MQLAVQQAISSMRARYFDPITLNDLASEVFVSPFHFSRIFTKATGVTPGRYLTAVRLFEAKRLLLTTSLTVSDIVCSVGYSSVGTFTSRFTKAVGMTPTQYRDPEVGQLLVAVAPDFHHLPPLEVLRRAGKQCVKLPGEGGSIAGTIELPPGSTPANVLIGVFAESIPQCGPVAYEALPNAGSSRLAIHDVPAGRWIVIAVAEHSGETSPSEGTYIGTVRQPITVSPGGTSTVRLHMRGLKPTDPPIAITLASQLSSETGRAGVRHLSAVPAAA
jgi:AraC family transcriptional regulator